MEDEEFVGCISCMGTNELFNLHAVYTDNAESYAQMYKNCFDIQISENIKHICSQCARKLENAISFKEETLKNVNMVECIQDEEYLDESLLNEDIDPEDPKTEKVVIIEKLDSDNEDNDVDDELDDEQAIQALEETTCIYCDLTFSTVEEVREHVREAHEVNTECSLCGAALTSNTRDHLSRCHGVNSEAEGRKYPCHFCENVYHSRKACYTHLRMKHGLKLSNEQTPRYLPRERKKCHLCSRDFSQKQILNKHLWKAHGFEVEKRKAFSCPLCSERVSYGAHFSEHLLRAHRLRELVEKLEFRNMDDFMLYKIAIQEETKYRFRKTTASKQTIEGLRSHYMCSQSGVYVYQGKGKRPAPERQIYKTGKACPAHMIVTETIDRVLLTFHKTHVGHGACPYYCPRDTKRGKSEPEPAYERADSGGGSAWLCVPPDMLPSGFTQHSQH